MVSCIYNIQVYNLNDNVITGLLNSGMPNNHIRDKSIYRKWLSQSYDNLYCIPFLML